MAGLRVQFPPQVYLERLASRLERPAHNRAVVDSSLTMSMTIKLEVN